MHKNEFTNLRKVARKIRQWKASRNWNMLNFINCSTSRWFKKRCRKAGFWPIHNWIRYIGETQKSMKYSIKKPSWTGTKGNTAPNRIWKYWAEIMICRNLSRLSRIRWRDRPFSALSKFHSNMFRSIRGPRFNRKSKFLVRGADRLTVRGRYRWRQNRLQVTVKQTFKLWLHYRNSKKAPWNQNNWKKRPLCQRNRVKATTFTFSIWIKICKNKMFSLKIKVQMNCMIKHWDWKIHRIKSRPLMEMKIMIRKPHFKSMTECRRLGGWASISKSRTKAQIWKSMTLSTTMIIWHRRRFKRTHNLKSSKYR